MFTIEGLGGEDLVNGNSEIGSGSITTNYPNGPLSAIGFQRLSKIQQIGYFRYLSRGAYLQANESPHLESWILFRFLVQEKFYPKLIT